MSLPKNSSPSSRDSFRPDLALRVGFAGKRDLTEAQVTRVKQRLHDVFGIIGWRLVEIAPMDDAHGERPVPAIAQFYSDRQPTLSSIP